jgi:dienelactone hydrolase
MYFQAMTTLANLKQLLGSAPAKVPLNADIVERVSRDGFEQIKVEYDLELDERIPVYLLVPDNATANAPALFCHHQHASNFEIGKR